MPPMKPIEKIKNIYHEIVAIKIYLRKSFVVKKLKKHKMDTVIKRRE